MSSDTPKRPPGAAPRVRILHLEDNREHRLLVRSVFEAEGFDCEFVEVETREAFAEALERDAFDLVLSDYALPSFDGISALAISRERHPDLPFVFFSGTMGEELAVETVKAGATDYVLKERVTRLVPSVKRALAEAQERRKSRAADAALRESEEKYRSMVETTNEWFWAFDLDSRITYSNEAAEAMSGFRPDELVGKDFLSLVHPEDVLGVQELLERCAREKSGFTGYTVRIRDKEGNYRHIEGNGVPILDESGRVTGFRGADRDITQRMLLEAQLRQSQKMEAVGTLAGGVAHDFNNLLTIILGYSGLLVEQLGAEDPLREEIREIQRAGERAAALTRQLLAFSRKQVLAPVVLDLNAAVAEMEKMLRRLIGEDVSLAAVLGPNLECVRADPGQIEQVIVNLVVNARDAMLRGGKVTIETRNIDLDDSYVRAHTYVRPGEYVCLSVSDTGTGMDAQTRSRIFEPFFTTKGPAKGTGLGLSTVYGIVKQSGGSIEVDTEPGRGTSFKIYLPRVFATEKPARPQTRRPPLGGSETILLVEDEEAVRRLAHLVLEKLGYTVLEAASAEEALSLTADSAHRVDLVLTDSVMPGMSGPELAHRLRSQRPGLKVLFMSGYTDDAIVRHGLLEASEAFLQKPFTPDLLARKVREVLES